MKCPSLSLNPPGELGTHFPYPRQNPNNEMKMRNAKGNCVLADSALAAVG